ncbi:MULTISPECIES: hypothetical protein [unclassified Flavobacterium]|jgi:hypothetical protein|uniref:hypothetical protein n=1 Tax=unclassified Flavobacterium TaxID=196869 RepID=UPI0025BA26CE|nr:MULTISPECIES: hypothetical protein [unclassified Flavobacterium]
MKPTYHYSTVAEALDDLNKNGYTLDFNLQDENIKKNPHNYEIKHVYRYEGDTDPGEEAVVYGIISNSGERGVYVAGFSANSESEAATVLAKLCIEGSDQQCRT